MATLHGKAQRSTVNGKFLATTPAGELGTAEAAAAWFGRAYFAYALKVSTFNKKTGVFSVDGMTGISYRVYTRLEADDKKFYDFFRWYG